MPTAWIGPPPKQWSLHNRATEDWAFWFFLYPQPVRHCSSHSGWIFLSRFTGPHKNHFWKHPHRQTESHTWPIFSLFSSKPHWQPTLMITDHKQREWQSPGAREPCVVTELGDWESGWLWIDGSVKRLFTWAVSLDFLSTTEEVKFALLSVSSTQP